MLNIWSIEMIVWRNLIFNYHMKISYFPANSHSFCPLYLTSPLNTFQYLIVSTKYEYVFHNFVIFPIKIKKYPKFKNFTNFLLNPCIFVSYPFIIQYGFEIFTSLFQTFWRFKKIQFFLFVLLINSEIWY